MIKLIMCLCRHPEKTRAQFQEYWQNNHGPFFMKNAGILRAKRYVQSHTIDTVLNEGFKASRGLQPEYDGVAEVWFESEADLMEAMNTPDGQEFGVALLKDESTFIDHSKSAAFIVREQEF